MISLSAIDSSMLLISHVWTLGAGLELAQTRGSGKALNLV